MTSTQYNTHSAAPGRDMQLWLRQQAGDSDQRLERLRRNLRTARDQELTGRQRQLLELYYDRGYRMAEIAALLGLSRSSVSRTLKRAREKLYRCLRYGL